MSIVGNRRLRTTMVGGVLLAMIFGCTSLFLRQKHKTAATFRAGGGLMAQLRDWTNQGRPELASFLGPHSKRGYFHFTNVIEVDGKPWKPVFGVTDPWLGPNGVMLVGEDELLVVTNSDTRAKPIHLWGKSQVVFR